MAHVEQTADGLTSFRAVVEGAIIHIHADKLVGELRIEVAGKLHGVGQRFITMFERVLNALAQRGGDLQHVYGEHRYPAQLVLQDVRTLHGRQFGNAALIVASPPCQDYSYRAMPWKRAKALPPPSNELFDACFRIQREATAAAGFRIPLVVENVKGAVSHGRGSGTAGCVRAVSDALHRAGLDAEAMAAALDAAHEACAELQTATGVTAAG